MAFKKRGFLLITIALTSILYGCHKEESQFDSSPSSLPPTPVSVAKATKRIAGNQAELVGTVEAVEKAEIAAKITGNIINLQVDLGTKVTQGELLIELSAREISARVQQAKAQLEQARRNLTREESLLKKNAATPQTVKSLQDTTRIAEAAYKEAAAMLEYTKITAPFSGIITNKLSNVGDLATPGKPLLLLEQEDNLQVLTDVPEAMILRIHKGDLLSVFVPSVDLVTEGVVAEVSPIADPSSRSAPIKLRIPPDPRLRSGLFARVTLMSEQKKTLSVPASAVIPFGQMERIFTVQDGKAILRLVRTGNSAAGRIEILSGLSEGETVITRGNLTLLDGQPVNVE